MHTCQPSRIIRNILFFWIFRTPKCGRFRIFKISIFFFFFFFFFFCCCVCCLSQIKLVLSYAAMWEFTYCVRWRAAWLSSEFVFAFLLRFTAYCQLHCRCMCERLLRVQISYFRRHTVLKILNSHFQMLAGMHVYYFILFRTIHTIWPVGYMLNPFLFCLYFFTFDVNCTYFVLSIFVFVW